jgi:MYXO-CTERM domain-containing protein
MRAPIVAVVGGLLLVLTGCPSGPDGLVDGGSLQAFAVTDHVTNLGPVTDFRFLPGGKMVIIEKTGTVRVRRADGSMAEAGSFPVNTASEQGLLGVEVHPAFASNRTLFFYYSRSGSQGGTDLDRHRVVSVILREDDTLDMGTETILVRGLRGPANHDGGALAIGPDGKLYIGVGDTGCNSGARPGGTVGNFFATCLTNGNGKILRVELDGSIPADNPLAGQAEATACGAGCRDSVNASASGAPRKEIWAWGLRNPFRISFDPRTGNLWVGDVGEVTNEELNIVQGGKHYGWPWREGAAGRGHQTCADITPQSGPCVDPVYFCQHGGSGQVGVDSDCTAITGGTFVDSCRWPDEYRGHYYFGDSSTGAVWFLKVNAARDGVAGPGARMPFSSIRGGGPVSFQVGPDGNLYVAVIPFSGAGRIIRFTPREPLPCDGGVDLPGDDPGGGGCGCSAGPAGSSALLVGLGLVLLLQARARRRPQPEQA